MAAEVMLTTNDNPYNPFDQFDQWLLYDKEKGYNTCERLMRVAAPKLFEGMSQKEEDEAVDQAMDELIEVDILNVFVKGTQESIQKLINSNKNNKKLLKKKILKKKTKIPKKTCMKMSKKNKKI